MNSVEEDDDDLELLERANNIIGKKHFFSTKGLAEELDITGKKASILFIKMDWERWSVGSNTVVYRNKEVEMT